MVKKIKIDYLSTVSKGKASIFSLAGKIKFFRINTYQNRPFKVYHFI